MHVCTSRQVWEVVVVFMKWFRAFLVHNVFSHHHVFMTLCCFIVLHIYIYIYSNSLLYFRWRFLPRILQNRVWQVKLWDSLLSLELDVCLCISKMSGVLTKLPRQACAWHLVEGLHPLYDHPDIIYLIPSWCKQGIWTWEALLTKSPFNWSAPQQNSGSSVPSLHHLDNRVEWSIIRTMTIHTNVI